MLDDELNDVVATLRALGGDDADIEAKRATDKLPKSVRETLSAFANTRGGVLILGIDETAGFEATGVNNPAKISSDLAALCSEDMEPPLRPIIKAHRYEGAELVVAEVPALEPERRPCYYRGAGMTQGSFIRVGDGDRRLSSYEVQLMLANRGQPRDDEEPVRDVGRSALDDALIEGFVTRLRYRRAHAFGDLDTDSALRRAKVLVGDNVTVAGLLALGRYPQEHFPQLMVTFVHYPTPEGADITSGERFIDNVAAEGPIPTMVQETLVALRRNMSRRSTVRGAGRVDTWEYPEAALREAIVNALVHRDYSPQSRGTQVQVEMYPDRLIVRNPGGLFGGVTAEMLGDEGVSSTRNATLLKLLEDVPIADTGRTVCENRGSGIQTMLIALRNAGMKPPQFTDTISSFRVTFPNHALIGPEVVEWIRKLDQSGLTDSQCMGLAMLKNGDVLDNKSYRSASGLDSRRATTELGDLVSRGLIVQTGGRRWTRYQLASDLDERQAGYDDEGRTRADRRRELLSALGDHQRTRAELAEITGLSDKTVLRWLKILRKEGSVEEIGSIKSPGVRYRRTGTLLLEEGSNHK